MFGDNPFAIPISSFQRPVPLVLVDPDDEPDYNVCFRKEWLPYILGSLQQLWLQTTWDSDDPDAVALEQQRAKLLTQMFMTGCDVCEAPLPASASGCYAFENDSTIITYAPQDPFKNPDYIPPGYIAVPFLVVRPGDVLSFLPGVELGDVYSGYLSLPVTTPGVGQGLARFRVHVTGAGVVELHLLKIPGGGAVLITTDDDPASARYINVNKDIIQSPSETVSEMVIEVPFTTLGEHHIDVTFMPRFDDSPLFIGYGGGLRRVVLCGFDQTINQEIEERARKGAIGVDEGSSMAIRVDPDRCYMLQFECSPGQWVDLLDTRCGAQEQQRQPTNGTPLADGECREWDVVLRGNEQWLLPLAVSAADVVTVTGAAGAWSDGTPQWNCVSGQIYILGGCTTNDAADSGDPMMSVNHMRLVMQIDTAWFDGYNTTTAVPTGVSDAQVVFQANDGSLSDNSGSVTFHVKVCRPAAAPVTVELSYPAGSGPSSTQLNQPFAVNFDGVGGFAIRAKILGVATNFKWTVVGFNNWNNSGTFGNSIVYVDKTGSTTNCCVSDPACDPTCIDPTGLFHGFNFGTDPADPQCIITFMITEVEP